MKALIALVATALTMLALTASASAATAPDAIGRWGVVQLNPRMIGVVQPNPRSWRIVNPGMAGQNAYGLGASRPLGAIGRW